MPDESEQTWAEKLIGQPRPDLSHDEVSLLATLNGNEEKYAQEHQRWQELWQLSLAVGNGAGLLGVSSMMFGDRAGRWQDALVVAAWCFAIGLLGGGALPLLRSRRNLFAGLMVTTVIVEIRSGQWDTGELDKASRRTARMKLLMDVAAPLAVAAFLLGVGVPLLSMTLYG